MSPEATETETNIETQGESDVTTRLLQAENASTHGLSPGTRNVLARLYLSHTLSTWNSRMFEFGAVLFLASVFQGTLLYVSIYALVRSLLVALLSSWLGDVVDRSNRLAVLRQSIVWQRIPVAVSCACFVVLLASPESSLVTPILFLVVTLLACAEKLASAVNTVAVERDWIVVISGSLEIPRQDLNASMRRIDLICKLFAPVVVSLVDVLSTKVAVWTTLGVNVLSVLVEYRAIEQVYKSVPGLTRTPLPSETAGSSQERTTPNVMERIHNALAPWREYVSNRVFLASFALSLLYLTVLTFGTTMTTYLLDTSFSPFQVSIMRIGAVIAELMGTWAAPFVMNRIGPIRSGLWFINWQFGCLAVAAAGFLFQDPNSQSVALSLICGVALSRIGLWGFDLSVQYLIQENVEEQNRARFSTTEVALQNIFELLSFASTIIFSSPEQFKYPVLISYGAIALAAICFAAYTRKERGHLLHMSKCLGGNKIRPSFNPANRGGIRFEVT